jgi:hypothetical protein
VTASRVLDVRHPLNHFILAVDNMHPLRSPYNAKAQYCCPGLHVRSRILLSFVRSHAAAASGVLVGNVFSHTLTESALTTSVGLDFGDQSQLVRATSLELFDPFNPIGAGTGIGALHIATAHAAIIHRLIVRPLLFRFLL